MGEIILFIVALILFLILAPIGFLFAFLPKDNWWYNIKRYLGKVSYTIDQSGNVICKDLFNWMFIKNNDIEFGNPDETISSVLGKNKLKDNLTIIGNILDFILSKLDTNHSIKSIEYDE